MKTEHDTWDLLQAAIKERTHNFAPGFRFTVTQDYTKASQPWVLDVEQPHNTNSKECWCNPVVVESFRDT